MMIELEFDGRKPSLSQINAAISKARTQGATYIVLRWGENQINLEKSPYTRSGWTGHGWIGRNGGQDIADSLKEKQS